MSRIFTPVNKSDFQPSQNAMKEEPDTPGFFGENRLLNYKMTNIEQARVVNQESS